MLNNFLSCKRSEATYERYQERNREIALSRIENRIVQALVIPKKRIKTKPTKASKERKLKLKKKILNFYFNPIYFSASSLMVL